MVTGGSSLGRGSDRGWKVWKESLKAVGREREQREKALQAEESTWRRLNRAQTSQ